VPAQTQFPPWNDLRVLLAVHRGKSFLAAGKELGVATSTVARRVEALERSMGRSLVHRGSSGTVVAADALPLVALSEQMELGLDALRRDVNSARIGGTVRISVIEGLLRPLTQVLARLRLKHPSLNLELMSESRVADLARREADIGVRMARTTSPAVIEKAVGQAAVALFAARSYLDRNLPGARLKREAAAQQDWVGMDRALERLPQEQWMRAYGASRFVFRSNSAIAIEAAVQSGIGIGLLSEAQGRALEGVLRVETDGAPPPIALYIALSREAKKLPAVRAVVDELEGELRRALH
jgi:DNA-binding transcriptional LysR family regulator